MIKAHKGNIGTVITLSAIDDNGDAVDISGGTAYVMYWGKPDGTVDTWTASASGTSGIQYTTASGDLDVSGTGTLQGKVTYAGGNVFYTEKEDFEVLGVSA